MAANPFGAHQVGVHIADYMAYRYATGHDVVGRAGRRRDQTIRRSGTPSPGRIATHIQAVRPRSGDVP